jgi:IS605 OrfB family transposase
MNLTLMVKLSPSPDQHTALLATMERVNAACDAIAAVAFREHTANKIRLQPLVYHDIRARFGLSAQLTIRAIAKVCEAYKRDTSTQPTFRPHGAIVYDQRILSWKGLDHVSILTLAGRQLISLILGGYQAQRLSRLRGQADLLYRDGTFSLAVVVDAPEPAAEKPTDWLGVDLGLVNIAADSDGEQHAGAHLNGLRHRHTRLRKKLQAKGTKAAKRLLRHRRRKESRLRNDINHCIAKKLVGKAQDTARGIALEELTGIRQRITVRKSQRRQHASWSFADLRAKILYKATLAGVKVILVDPRNTSRTCPACGCVDKRNRPSQALFSCIACHYSAPADLNAAVNIRRRAPVSVPDVSDQAHTA